MRALRFLSLSLLTLVILQSGCGGGGSPSSPGQTIQGRILDTTGQAVSGVKVKLGDAETKSDSEGDYTLKAIKTQGAVSFEKSGYVTGRERVTLEDFTVALDAVLLKRGAKVTLNADEGGEVTGERGSRVTIPKSAIVDEDGDVVKGDINVYLTPIDPSLPSELRAAPGDFVADEDGDQAILESFGMVDITIEQDGKELNVKDGEVLTAIIPPPSGIADPPATMPLYSFDEEAGIWVLEGTATYRAERGGYEAELPHLSAWNCDQPLEATCEGGKVVDQDGQPVPGARVRGSGVSYAGQSEAVADQDGKFVLPVRKNSEVDIIAEHPRGGGKTRRINSGNSNTAIPPESGSDDCKDGGTWSLEEGKFDGKDCDEFSDVFADNECLLEFGQELGKCKAKFEGECTIEVGASGSVITYADGSKMVQSLTGSEVYGPDGELCYKSIVDVSGDVPAAKYDFGDGGTYEMEYSDSGDSTIHCPSGESFKISQEQSNAISACQPDTEASDPENMGGAGSGQGCKVISQEPTGSGGNDSDEGSGGQSSGGSPGSGGSSASGGSSPGFCTTNDECADATVCCDLGSDTLYCLDPATCDAFHEAGGG
jgi:hypothetical protein